jgi:hypothetical protein
MAYVSAADVIAGGGQLEPISVHELESFTNRLEHALNGAPTPRIYLAAHRCQLARVDPLKFLPHRSFGLMSLSPPRWQISRGSG